MKTLAVLALALSSTTFAAETCFQLSKDGVAWSRTPETICTDGGKVTLKSGLPFNAREVAVFNFERLVRARCFECNQDVYGLSNPSNSLFNDLKISFDGLRERDGSESGKVTIGENAFFYRKLK